MNKQNTTQNHFFLIFIEKMIRKIPLIYFLFRSLVKYVNYFENDFFYLKKIFKNKKINIIDVGASDGISALFFLRNLNPKNIYCFEPQKVFIKKLLRLSKKYKEIKVFNFGLGVNNKKEKIYIPYFFFFYKKIYLLTYSFSKKDELQKQINTDFIVKPKIEKNFIEVKKFGNFKEKIDLIKIDTNGSEIYVIRSILKLIKKNLPLLIIENNNIDKIYKELKPLGYKKFIIENNKLSIHKNQNNANIIFKI